MPITPDYAGPDVRYADGVFDGRFNRYIAVREGTYIFTCKHIMFCYYNFWKGYFLYSLVCRNCILALVYLQIDHRGVDAKPTNEIVSVALNGNTIEGM